MRPHILLVACTIIAAACYVGAVKDLTPDNFDAVVDGSKHVFVRFYAPWGGHCKAMAPDYKKFGGAFKKVGDVVIAQVDAYKHGDLGSRFDVKGFPTLKFFPKGSTTPEEYNGNRDVDAFINFVNAKAGTNVTWSSNVVVLTPENFDQIVLDSSKDVLVKFYAPWSGQCKLRAPMYEQLADVYKRDSHVVIAKFDIDMSHELTSKYGPRSYPSFIFFPKDDKTGLQYEYNGYFKDFVDYLNEKTGAHRTAEGRLNEKAGRVEALDALAKEFTTAAQDDLAAIVAKAEATLAVAEETVRKDAVYYMDVMKSAAEKGKEFVKSEAERIDHMLSSDMDEDQLDEFTVHKNILSVFEL